MIKQVILIRRDLGMRRGKECAQAAHASALWVTNGLAAQMHSLLTESPSKFNNGQVGFNMPCKHVIAQWIGTGHAKIVVKVNSEKELLDLVDKAREAGIMADYITDRGDTEFKGVPTITAAAIGPDLTEKIDTITSHLTLY